jgi:hypothetical protein
MKRGEEIPPPVVTRDNYYVDGNTRGQAWEKNGVKRAHVILVHENYEGASNDLDRRLRGLGAALNIRHGLRPDRESIRGAVLKLAEDDQLEPGRIADLLGEPVNAVTNVIRENNGVKLLEGHGVHVNGNVSAGVLRMFGSRFDKWHAEPQAAMAKLAIDAGFNTKEIRDLAQKIEAEAKSEAEVLRMLAAEREANDVRIRQVRYVGRGKPTPWGKAKRTLGQFLSIAEDVDRVIDPNPSTASAYMVELKQARDTLERVIEAQEAKLAQLELSES